MELAVAGERRRQGHRCARMRIEREVVGHDWLGVGGRTVQAIQAVKLHSISFPMSSSGATIAWRAGREAGSGNISSQGTLSAGRWLRSFIQTVSLTMSAVLPPAGLDDAAHVVEHEAALFLDGRGGLAGRGVVALDAAALEQRPDAACRRDRVLVAEAFDVDAGARGRCGAAERRVGVRCSFGGDVGLLDDRHPPRVLLGRNAVNCSGALPRASEPSA